MRNLLKTEQAETYYHLHRRLMQYFQAQVENGNTDAMSEAVWHAFEGKAPIADVLWSRYVRCAAHAPRVRITLAKTVLYPLEQDEKLVTDNKVHAWATYELARAMLDQLEAVGPTTLVEIENALVTLSEYGQYKDVVSAARVAALWAGLYYRLGKYAEAAQKALESLNSGQRLTDALGLCLLYAESLQRFDNPIVVDQYLQAWREATPAQQLQVAPRIVAGLERAEAYLAAIDVCTTRCKAALQAEEITRATLTLMRLNTTIGREGAVTLAARPVTYNCKLQTKRFPPTPMTISIGNRG